MGQVSQYKVVVQGVTYHVSVEDETGQVSSVAQAAPAAPQAAPAAPAASGARTPVNTMMPGNVTQIMVSVGQAVKEGDTLLMLEAMKMESPIPAPKAGTVASLEVKQGDTVAAGQVLLYIA